ncbi:DUF3891 family protein [Aquibacillus halophilus]|uniref:DUF3891 family protein n=1 Tax=Aquibacillus halophilus TaxID=930132 RepID=A0A6A8DIS8_9BACI|nr:DUF3891 family protein [Aquibacillus halophilus]MRH45160.1 DUF3891 family protein [Aquibacillus halophilus]
MIIRHTPKYLELTNQHEHAYISYEIAQHWKTDYYPYPKRKSEVNYAIRNHDCAWIPLDKHLLWNKEKNEPYDFVSFPLHTKLNAYHNGIREVEKETKYGAILCSLHYTSFLSKESDDNGINKFLEKEQQYRMYLLQQLNLNQTDEQILQHLDLLQFCDDLSLYICLNKPGARKEEEFPWFRDGFRQKFLFAANGMKADWISEDKIKLDPFPFEIPFTLSYRYSTMEYSNQNGEVSQHFRLITFV